MGNRRNQARPWPNAYPNEKPKRHRNPDLLDKLTDLTLKPKTIEFWGKYGNFASLDLKQPVLKFSSELDENEKKVAFGQLHADTYEKVVIYFEDEGKATFDSNQIVVKTYNRISAEPGKLKPFTLKPGQHYSIRISIDLRDSLRMSHDYLKFEPSGDRIDAVEEISMENVQVREREIMIRLSPSITEDDLRALFEDNQIDPFRVVPGVNYVQAFVREGNTTYDALAGILSNPNVLQADFNYAMQGRGFSDEPSFSVQKDLWTQLDLTELENSLPGNPIKVAVLDTGLDPGNTDLSGAYSDFADPITGESSALDTSGHGTEIASIIAARNNGFGIAGINPNIQIIPVKVLTGPGTGDYVTLAQALMYAWAKGAKVINLSLGGYVDNPILSETISLLAGQGVVFVAAAGNDATDIPVYPASYPQVISVASVSSNNGFSSFSNFGEAVDVSAPGEDIPATSLGGAVVRRSGTSYSAAIISGLVATALAENPNLTFDQISDLISKSSDFAGRRYTTNSVGSGMLNAKRFVRNLRGQNLSDVQIARIEPVQPALVINQPSNVRFVIENRGNQIVPLVNVSSTGQDSSLSPQTASNLQPFERRELIQPYIPRIFLDGIQSVDSQLNFSDEIVANNRYEAKLPVVKTPFADLRFGKIKAALVSADGENLKFKITIPVLNPTANAISNVGISLSQSDLTQETSIGTETTVSIASGDQAFFHFFIQKPDSEAAVFNLNLIARSISGFSRPVTALGSFEFNKASSGQITAMHKERIHRQIAAGVVGVYLPNYVSLPSNVIQEFNTYASAIWDGECREDGDECSDHDEYFHTVDPLFSICDGAAPCALISNEHFWRIDDSIGNEKYPGVGTFAWLSSFYNSNGVPNAWQRAYVFQTGQSIDGFSTNTGYISIKQLYQNGQKSTAYRMLGHLLHLMQDMSLPVHAHGQQHFDPRDAEEDWEGASGWDEWNGDFNAGAQKAKQFYDQHFRNSGTGLSNLLTIPQYLRGQTPTIAAQDPETFPLFYLMSLTNARGGWFADYVNDGKDYSRPWTLWPRGLYKISPSRLRSHDELSDNENGFVRNILKLVCVLALIATVIAVCSLSFIPIIGPAICILYTAFVIYSYDYVCNFVLDYVLHVPAYNNYDGDLSTIRDQTLPVAYLATATMMCHFAEQTNQVVAGTCPQANNAADDPNQFSIGGATLGLTGSITVQDGGVNTTLSQNGTFLLSKFAVAGQAYNLSIVAQPPGQSCTLLNAQGTVVDRDIRNIGVKCATIGDVTPASDVTAFSVVSSAVGNTCANVLSWANPPDGDFFGGLIVRNESRVPLDTSDGVVVFQNVIPSDNNLVPEGVPIFATNFNDTQVNPGQFYYYKIFTQDTAGNLSGGVYQSVTTANSCASGCIGGCTGGGGGCFVATAAFGESRELSIFREFRDSVLMKSDFGRTLVSHYYKSSPPIAAFISEHQMLRGITADILKPVAAVISVTKSGGTGRDWLILIYHAFIWIGIPAMMIIYRNRKTQYRSMQNFPN
jgi:hypothetical protein